MNGEIKVYERIKYAHGIKDVPIRWIWPFDSNTLELAGIKIMEETHNGFDKYVIEKKGYRFT